MCKMLNTFFLNNEYFFDDLFVILPLLFISPLWFWMYLRLFYYKFSISVNC